jgi:hypothetical protein
MAETGDRLIAAALNGSLDGKQVGNLLYQLLPAMPHETGGIPLPIPRFFLGGAATPAAPKDIVPPAEIPPAAEAHLQADGSYKIDGQAERYDHIVTQAPPRRIQTIDNLKPTITTRFIRKL